MTEQPRPADQSSQHRPADGPWTADQSSQAGQPGSSVGAGAPPPPSTSESVPPSGYTLASPYVPPVTTGFGTGGLVSGIGSAVLGLLSCCWWPFAVLPLAMAASAIALGYLGIRQVAGSGGEVTGRGTAISAIVAGAVGLLFTLAAVALGLVLQAGQDSLP